MRLDLICRTVLLLGAPIIIPTVAQADTSHSYIISSCDPARRVAQISTVNAFEGEDPPKNSFLLDSLPPDKGNGAALPICDLGPKRKISIKGIVDDDHPRNDGIRIYVNSRPMQHNITTNYDTVITYTDEQYYVNVKQCEQHQPNCLTETVTSPSFQCDNSNSTVEKMICRSDALSAADVELAHAYQLAIDRVSKPNSLVRDEVQWLKDRKIKCNVRDWTPNNSAYDRAFECIRKAYTDRILNLRNLSTNAK